MILDRIQKENDIKRIHPEEYADLAQEIRSFLIQSLSQTGGHLASNLGAVELTMALHLALTLPEDKIIWDVGHQSYTHKLLTGRRERFSTLRQLGGLSGFPKRTESPCDAFDTGHSSTSLSAGLGLVAARDRLKQKHTIVSVIGDGALTGGMAYEALNNASRIHSNFIIILNDNNMSISENVGGLPSYLSHIRVGKSYNALKDDIKKKLGRMPGIGDTLVNTISQTKSGLKQLLIPGMLFENLGLTYLGPIDGHNVSLMTEIFTEAKRIDRPLLIHVRTEKGRGYEPARRHPDQFHGVGPFEIATGKPKKKEKNASYTDVFSQSLCELGQREEKLCVITAAMEDGTGTRAFRERFPDRFFDVGIAEEHAVTFAAAMAAGGLKPVVAIYSSFLQRAYDQLIHDVCIDRLPVTFIIDRAGIVGNDGETHQGIFDLSYLLSIPDMTVMAPKNSRELREMLAFGVSLSAPVAIRFPRSAAWMERAEEFAPLRLGECEPLKEGEEPVTLFAIGSMVKTALEAAALLEEKGLSVSVVNARFAKPFDRKYLSSVAQRSGLLAVLEENTLCGGLGEAVSHYLLEQNARCRVLLFGVPDCFVRHGSPAELKEQLGLSAEQIADRLLVAWQQWKKTPEGASLEEDRA